MKGLNTPNPLDPPLMERVRALPGAVVLMLGFFLSRVRIPPRQGRI